MLREWIFACVRVCVYPVSYTHLDVYKRQALHSEFSVASIAERFLYVLEALGLLFGITDSSVPCDFVQSLFIIYCFAFLPLLSDFQTLLFWANFLWLLQEMFMVSGVASHAAFVTTL